MADDKAKGKDKAKPAAGGGELFNKDHYKEVLYVVLPGLIILTLLLNQFLAYINNAELYGSSTLFGRILQWFRSFWSFWRVAGTILSGAAIVWGAYSFMKMRQVEREENKIYGALPEITPTLHGEASAPKENEKWVRVKEHAYSNIPSNWRLAIIEADIMLEEMLRKAGYHGDGVGELLKAVDPSDMLTLDAAWDAHKVRNRIAHSGQDFELTDRETKRVISLFESVFREFGVI